MTIQTMNSKDDFSPPESARSLWYDPFINRFKDEDDKIRNDLVKYFPVWQLEKWKKTKDYGILKDRKGDIWEIFYRVSSEYTLCHHACEVCVSKCEIYDMLKDW